METLLLEVRHAARKLLRQPAFSAAVVLLIALGVGAGTSVFTIVNSLLLTPPPLIVDADRMVRLAPTPGSNGISTYVDYEYYRDRARSYAALIGYDPVATAVQLKWEGQTVDAEARFVTGNFFQTLGIMPIAGRLLTPTDDAENAENTVVISERLQRLLFPATATGAVGAPLMINGHPFPIAGIVPGQFAGAARDDRPVDVWIPMWKRPLVTGRPRMDMVRTPDYIHAFMIVMGRLAAGATAASAQAESGALARQLQQDFTNTEPTDVVVTGNFGLSPSRRGLVVTITRLIGGLAIIVLMIVCANLANLMLARAVARHNETTVKLALGASRGRLMQQFAAEGFVLAMAGGAVGLMLAYWSARGLGAFLPFRLAAPPAPDLRVFACGFGLAALTAVACAMAPAWLSARTSAAHMTGARTTGGGTTARTMLVIAQVALCFILLTGAALFVRTLQRVHAVPLGFNPRGVLAVGFDPRAHGYDEPRIPQFYDRLVERARQLPGVQSVALGSVIPLSGARRTGPIEIEGRPLVPEQRNNYGNDLVSPDYFRTLGIRVVRGRDFALSDVATSPMVAVVNEKLAERFWPGQDPIGKRFRRSANAPWIEVVGVIEDMRPTDVTTPAEPFYYRPFAQAPFPRMQVYLRTTGDPLALAAAMRRATSELDPNVVPRSVDALETIYANGIRSFTVNARLVLALGILALILAAMGLYAVTSYLVTQRTREFGLRMAIGAQPADVLRQVMSGTAQRATAGIAIGAVASISLAGPLERFLFELSPFDPWTFLLAALTLAATMLLATLVPARRATRVDPMIALRTD